VQSWLRGWGDPGTEELMHGCGEGLGSATQLNGEQDLQTSPGIAIEEGALRNRDLQHLFETEHLCAQLNCITVVGLALAPLVLHRIELRLELDHIRASGEGPPIGAQRHAAHGADLVTARLAGQVRTFVQKASLSR